MSGGIRALHVLRDELRARGAEAWMTYERYDPESIMVYPEIVSSNPEDSSRITRWLLNRADLPQDGLTFAWEKGMGDWPLLTVDIIEPFWEPYRGPRSGVGYWVGKGVLDAGQVPAGAVEVTRSNYTTRHELHGFLKSLDYFISFDAFSAINIEAAICGTPVLVLGSGSWTKNHFEDHGWVKHGVAWGWGELQQARDEVGLAWNDYEKKRATFPATIDRFVSMTQEIYG
jgi:hypothetical protein